jgi:hypothetical protein
MRRFSLGVRLTAALALLLLAFGLLVAGLVHQVNQDRELESLQRLSHGLARHIVAHWPEVSDIDRARADRSARDAVIRQLMAVNPSINVYVLDADGKVDTWMPCAPFWPAPRCHCWAPTRWVVARGACSVPRCSRRARATADRRATCTWCWTGPRATPWPARSARAAPGWAWPVLVLRLCWRWGWPVPACFAG